MFAFASLLAGAPLGFVARAAEDTLAYRFPGAGDPAGARAPGGRALRGPLAVAGTCTC